MGKQEFFLIAVLVFHWKVRDLLEGLLVIGRHLLHEAAGTLFGNAFTVCVKKKKSGVAAHCCSVPTELQA